MRVLAVILSRLESLYDDVLRENFVSIIERWQHFSRLFGKEITIEQAGSTLRGVAKSISSDGGLIVQTNNHEVKVLAGDVSVLS